MLPQGFENRMRALLGEEYPAFAASIEEPAVRAMRVNYAKCSDEKILDSYFVGEPISYAKGGYYIKADAEGVGNSPEHHAGMIYMQDPGAMASLCSIEKLPGAKVCDLCAAPGGKTTQAAALIGNDGFILANEYVPKRAKILVGNIERLGIRNATVTSLDTAELAALFENYFDLVIADAPCSGEGMFRKGEVARSEWSEKNIALCTDRQEHILKNAAILTRPGGYLVYSTCTFSLEENELMLKKFLAEHTDFEICSVPEALKAYTSPGIVSEGAPNGIHEARRFYPHVSRGEGQFFALLRRCEGSAEPRLNFKDSAVAPSHRELEVIEKFLKENLVKIPDGRIIKKGDSFSIIPHGMPLLPRSVFSCGTLLGEIRGNLFFPAHQLFSAYGTLFRRKKELEYDEALRYIAGEELDTESGESGYCALLYHGAALGGGKASSGKIKNHYPKGLRHR